MSQLPVQSLTKLANLSATDKGTQAGVAHGYSLLYDMLLAPLRQRSGVEILEMGLAIGGPELGGEVDRQVTSSPSIGLWLSFFHDARIVGFDISDFSAIRHDRFTFVRGDSGKREDVARLAALGRHFDVILDDASHASYHQQLGLAVLFKLLKPGGLYVIEDLHWQPVTIERSLPAVPRTAKLLTEFLATGRFGSTAAITNEEASFLGAETAGVLLFDESTLNSLADTYNRKNGLPRVSRVGWRGKGPRGRLVDPGFWRFSFRRFGQTVRSGESVNWQSVKLAVVQRTLDG